MILASPYLLHQSSISLEPSSQGIDDRESSSPAIHIQCGCDNFFSSSPPNQPAVNRAPMIPGDLDSPSIHSTRMESASPDSRVTGSHTSLNLPASRIILDGSGSIFRPALFIFPSRNISCLCYGMVRDAVRRDAGETFIRYIVPSIYGTCKGVRQSKTNHNVSLVYPGVDWGFRVCISPCFIRC